jgi:type I restriction enzyme S subunit
LKKTLARDLAEAGSGAPPLGWRIVSLGQLVKQFQSGGTPSTSSLHYWSGLTPWITGADIVDQKFGQMRRFVSDEGLRTGLTQVVPAGGVLVVTRTGVGKVAIAPTDVAISQDITCVTVDETQVIGNDL